MSDTIFFPDVSAFQRSLVIQPATVFVWAKATEGTTVVDGSYTYFKAQAASVGAGFGAYHFLHAGNGSAQADHAFSVVGPGVPLFVDVEPYGTSYPTTADVLAFKARYRALGGLIEAMYYPKWYWTNQGSPDLSVTGLQLISSGYPAGYSDTDANWNPYGGLTPFQWQFTDQFEYGGMKVDFNAYKGTLAEYLVAIGVEPASPPPAPTPTPSPTPDPTEDDDMSTTSVAGRAGLSWPQGTRHVIQVGYDPAGGNPNLRVVLVLTTGPWVDATPWAVTGGSGVYEIPSQYIATCRGVILEESSNLIFDATAA